MTGLNKVRFFFFFFSFTFCSSILQGWIVFFFFCHFVDFWADIACRLQFFFLLFYWNYFHFSHCCCLDVMQSISKSKNSKLLKQLFVEIFTMSCKNKIKQIQSNKRLNMTNSIPYTTNIKNHHKFLKNS